MEPATTIEFETVHREFRPKVVRYLTKLAGPQEAPGLAIPSLPKPLRVNTRNNLLNLHT